VEAVLGGLKDFQRDTVDYVFRRLYQDEDAARRFLVADETGLGKTLVARGVIARAIDHLREKVPRIDVLYICSNADIARQNINRLNVTGKKDFALASRMTLLPTTVHQLEKNDLNFISFTPGTAFELGNTMGRKDERALLYHLLREPWGLGDRKAPLNVLQGQAGAQSFRNLAAGFKNDRDIDEKLEKKFQEDLERRIKNEKDEGGEDIRSRFEGLCGRFKQANTRHSWQDNHDRKKLVGELRGLLATACLEALEPDLIILDEFQRFKHLLDGTDASSQLAKGLFEYGDAKTLLLSATPYKMYTLAHEAAEDDHYADFLKTLEFLESGGGPSETPKATLAEYRRFLFRLAEDGPEQAEFAKRKLENRLRRVMVRTEKLAASQDRDGMLLEVPQNTLRLDSLDLEGYVSLRRVLDLTGGGDALEYWNSAPYLLNFMDGYKLKHKFAEALEEKGGQLVEAISAANGLLMSSKDISGYAAVDPANAKLRSLLADTVGAGAWKLLWVSPSQPYYQTEGPFSEPFAKTFTKRLIFSSWRVVPKVIAAMVSYEAERLMIRSYEAEPENSTEARARRGRLLQFAFSDGRLTGMPVLGILYPCATLAKECDPLLLAREANGEPITAARMLEIAARRIEPLLEQVGAGSVTTGPEDDAWYWAAPILFDLHHSERETREWFSRQDLAGIWSDRADGGEDTSRWKDHVEQARTLVSGNLSLGRPPKDLARVLASMALAGPGVAVLRALGRVAQDAEQSELRDASARVAWHLRSLFNLPETTSLLRSMADEGTPYWQSVLRYSVSGCLQAVFDEYAHVLTESLGLLAATPEGTAVGVSRAMCNALRLQASSMSVDQFEVDARANTVALGDGGSMRGRFALRFGGEKADDGSERTRTNQVREAFNSPFWPFVVATTSVGQEGLDFHTYCHAIVHWNLPSNPVDLEQREGRVHRYKNHAVRKNLAAHYGLSGMAGHTADPWGSLFNVARCARDEEATDMVPFWIYPLEGGAKIERHVPALPLSRDRDRIAALRRSLAAYRMVFGQARQEDLLSYLLARFTDEEVTAYAESLRIDLQPPRKERASP